jgi:branched-chain amino acid transport system ATP-binding protein
VILEAVKIRKNYGAFCALNRVSLGINEGEFVSIIGPNGAGKTTLINVLTGFLKPDEGTVLFKGDDITGRGPEKLTKLGIARSFQLVHIFPELSVLETIKVAIISRQGKGTRMFASLAKDKDVHEQALEVAELFHFSDRLNERISPRAPRNSWMWLRPSRSTQRLFSLTNPQVA